MGNEKQEGETSRMKKLIVGLLIATVLTGYGYGIWWAVDDYNTGKDVVVSRTYEGRLYLPAGEYESFKQYLADNPQVEIARLDVLSSPNALVDMSLVAPGDTVVPYGEVVDERRQSDKVILALIFPMTAGLGFVLVLMWGFNLFSFGVKPND